MIGPIIKNGRLLPANLELGLPRNDSKHTMNHVLNTAIALQVSQHGRFFFLPRMTEVRTV
jgi:hypothetical protein